MADTSVNASLIEAVQLGDYARLREALTRDGVDANTAVKEVDPFGDTALHWPAQATNVHPGSPVGSPGLAGGMFGRYLVQSK